MINLEDAIKAAMAFDQAEEKPHFHKISFRIKNKIFATLDSQKNQMVIKLSEADQSVFSAFNKSAIYPVPGGWGKQGWTIIELSKVNKEHFLDALTTSYITVAPKKLGDKYRPTTDE